MRVGRDARFGKYTCGTCTAKQKDELRCVLKGHERPPAKTPAYRVAMGSARAVLTKSCPVGLSLNDDRTSLYLTAYGMVKKWAKWPPGRDDPRTLEALTVIQREHDLIDLERDTAPTKQGAKA